MIYNQLNRQGYGLSGGWNRNPSQLPSLQTRTGMSPIGGQQVPPVRQSGNDTQTGSDYADLDSSPVLGSDDTAPQGAGGLDSTNPGVSDIGELGPFGREALIGSLENMGMKGITSGVAGYSLGAPASAAAKFGLTSSIAPAAVLSGIGSVGLGALDDVALQNRMSEIYAGAELSPEQLEAMRAVEKTIMEEQGFMDSLGDRLGALGSIGTQMKEDIGLSALEASMNPRGAYARGMSKDPMTASVADLEPSFSTSRTGWGPQHSSYGAPSDPSGGSGSVGGIGDPSHGGFNTGDLDMGFGGGSGRGSNDADTGMGGGDDGGFGDAGDGETGWRKGGYVTDRDKIMGEELNAKVHEGEYVMTPEMVQEAQNAGVMDDMERWRMRSNKMMGLGGRR